MAALFEVPGWSVPSKPVSDPSQNHKKRKRGQSGQTDKIQAASTNIEKLIEKLGSKSDAAEGQPKKKQKARGNSKPSTSSPKPGSSLQSKRKPRVVEENETRPLSMPQDGDKAIFGKKKQKQRRESTGHDASEVGSSKKAKTGASDKGLTSLQENMKSSLDGARFRWINETLYKSDSHNAVQMMKENPSVFDEYHTGFRHQVQSWPSNPVSHYISALSKYPKRTVVVDLGCGDATLARALIPEGYTVLSYDLVSNNEFVIEADICAKLPLPGGEGKDSEASDVDDESVGGQVIDIVVCALSLMGTNWPSCIREAWRVLKFGGELKIAEVASRFTDIEEFTSLISSIGFKFRSKDDSNTHFTLFEFSKVKRKAKSTKEWAKILSRGSLLKPCEYKRR